MPTDPGRHEPFRSWSPAAIGAAAIGLVALDAGEVAPPGLVQTLLVLTILAAVGLMVVILRHPPAPDGRPAEDDPAHRELLVRVQELERQRDDARRATATRDRFLASMSHELRTPLTAILGYAELLAGDPTVSGEADDHVRTVQRNGRHLLDLINDVLDHSKIEAGGMEVERVECDLPELLRDVIELMAVRARAKGIELALTIDDWIPELFFTDPTRLRQVLVNLLGNAIKFTDLGSVRLRVGVDGGLLRLEVVDTGIGMTEEEAARVFDAYAQADRTIGRRFGGTGLGLSIAAALVECLGGGIEIESDVGAGTTFRCTVDPGPLQGRRRIRSMHEAAITGAVESRRPSGDALAGRRVLLVEDGPDNQRLISTFLRGDGASVVVAEDGSRCLDHMKAVLDGAAEPVDAILMDMQMPVLDGYEATILLRVKGVEVPIVALTAHAMAEERHRCLAIGCDGFLSKPIDRTLLVETLAGLLAPPAAVRRAG